MKANLRMHFSKGCRPASHDECSLQAVLRAHCNSQSSRTNTFHKHFPVKANGDVSVVLTDIVRAWRNKHQTTGCLTLMILFNGGGGGGAISHRSRKMKSSVLSSLLTPPHKPVLVIHTEEEQFPGKEDHSLLIPTNIDIDAYKTTTISKGRYSRQSSRSGQLRPCSRVRHYVNFKRIGLDRRIIAPRGINMNYCSGHCAFPLARNRTLHAEIQSLLHILDEGRVPAVCCSAMSYQPIVLLYYTDNGTLTLKRFFKISVKKCGCT